MTSPFSDISVAIVGSANLDMIARVRTFPKPGETVSDAQLSRFPGGKGGNQALACRRLGAEVYLLACVGQDPAAGEALASLEAEGVLLDHCRRLPRAHTGLAMILVSDDGENQIVVAPGANAAFTPELLNLPLTDAVIAQLEVPLPTILKAAHATDAFFCLNAAPARAVPKEVLNHTDLLVVNEIEAQHLADTLPAYRGLLAVTLGSRGAVLSHYGKEIARAKPPEVRVLDTTGAGDAFTAALTLALVAGIHESEALHLACRAGAYCATRPGAQTAPDWQELLACGNMTVEEAKCE